MPIGKEGIMPDRPGILLLSCPDAEELAAGLATRWGGQVAVFPFSDLPSVDEMAEHCRRHGLDALLLVGDTLPLCPPPEYAPPLWRTPDGASLPLHDCTLPPLPSASALERHHAAHKRRSSLYAPPASDGSPAAGSAMPSPEQTFEAARLARHDCLHMAVARLLACQPPVPRTTLPQTLRLLVLGGGWTGLAAAQAAASCGLSVLLIEKNDVLGGAARFLPPELPCAAPWDEAVPLRLAERIQAVQTHPAIQVLRGVELASLTGQPGDFLATLTDGSRHACGGVLLATGWQPSNLPALLGLAGLPLVLTAGDFVRRLQEDRITGAHILFLTDTQTLEQQALARAPEAERPLLERRLRQLHAAHGVNSLGMLSLARAVAERSPAQRPASTLLFRQMTLSGVLERYYRKAQAHPALRLARGEALDIAADAEGVRLRFRQAGLGGRDGVAELKADLLVLPECMPPAGDEGMLPVTAGSRAAILPDCSRFDGYAASSFICFPYETRRTGIVAAGCAREPQSLESCAEDAQGAVLALLRDMRAVAQGLSPHPRSGDGDCPQFELSRCTRCNRCVEECPFGALEVDAEGLPRHFPARCRRCGVCFGACPERVVSLAGQNMRMGQDMMDAVSLPSSAACPRPLALVLACENDALPALREAQARWGAHPAVRIMGVRCLGSVNVQWLVDALTGRYDGVLLLGCADGEDAQCHFGTGSALCRQRLHNLAETLLERGLDARRVRLEPTGRDAACALPDRLDLFLECLAALGPSPFVRD